MKKYLQEVAEGRDQPGKNYGQDLHQPDNISSDNSRRSFMKKAVLGGIAMGGFMNLPISEAVARVTSNVQRASGPSDLKITDMRVAVIAEGGKKSIIRIDTNQGIYGLGEVRDGGDERYALILKAGYLG
jgi:hypothetical protein